MKQSDKYPALKSILPNNPNLQSYEVLAITESLTHSTMASFFSFKRSELIRTHVHPTHKTDDTTSNTNIFVSNTISNDINMEKLEKGYINQGYNTQEHI